MAISCPKCNTYNPDTLKFCGECGTQLPSSKDIEVTETLETPKEELTTGSTFAGRYQIIEELGKGGMGRVYKVLDKEVNAKVALKLIKPEIASDKKTIDRFRNELKVARDIAHKNVCRMYDLGKEEGAYYITMEYVSGENLKSFIRRSGLISTGKAVTIAKQVCDGLVEAHRLGVVHRDLKPQNIMIDKDGNARIMDFGIARSLRAKSITGSGVMIGTPEYMSPEQVDGREADKKADIYSLGVILYEMLTGRVPFEGDTPFSIGVKQKSEVPQPPKEINEQIPEELNNVILKCMEKEKEKRYQSANELHSELMNLEKGIPTTDKIVSEKKPITSKEITITVGLKKLYVPSIIIFAMVTVAIVMWQVFLRNKEIPVLEERPSVAVLPFEDFSPQKDQEYFCNGMMDEIIAKLSRLEGLKVIPRTSVMRYKDTEKDIKEIGQELDVSTILEGSVRKEKDDIRVIASLIRVSDSSQIWTETFDKKLIGVFQIQGEIAENIGNALIKELSSEEKDLLQDTPTENIEAYNLYLLGRHFWDKRTEESISKAIAYFERAIEVDHNYALAYTGLADSYLALPYYGSSFPKEAFPIAKEAALKALEYDDTLAEPHASLGWIEMAYEWNWSGAEREFKRAIELNPRYPTAHQWYGQYLAYMERFDESVKEFKKALELDPLSAAINRNLGSDVLYFAREYHKAIETLKKTIEIEPEYLGVHSDLGQCYLQLSRYKEALIEFQKASSERGVGLTYALMGKREEALDVLANIIRQSKETYIPATGIAYFYFALGENDLGFDWMDKAREEKDPRLYSLRVHPMLDGVRSDPRYIELVSKVGLENQNNFPKTR